MKNSLKSKNEHPRLFKKEEISSKNAFDLQNSLESQEGASQEKTESKFWIKLLEPESRLQQSQVERVIEKLLGKEQCLEWSFDLLREQLPKVQYEKSGKSQVAFFMLCMQREGISQFFLEMVARWLFPMQKTKLSFFSAIDFVPFHPSSQKLIAIECNVWIESNVQWRQLVKQFPLFQSEIGFGALSNYHAQKVIEAKALTHWEKMSAIQRRLSEMIHRFPRLYDSDIFHTMQRIFLEKDESFFQAREIPTLIRMVKSLYSIERMIQKNHNSCLIQREVFVKPMRFALQQLFQEQKILALAVGVRINKDRETFEETHLEAAVQKVFPGLKRMQSSHVDYEIEEEDFHLFYIEFELPSETVSLHHLNTLSEKLPSMILKSIEKRMHPLFMPRNDEEVLKTLQVLSSQLKMRGDLPQVSITLHTHNETYLEFFVAIARVMKGEDQNIEKILREKHTKLAIERSRILGYLRKKYAKEASILRMRVSCDHFLREDLSLDYYRARERVLAEVERIFGEVRDYNGGMLSRQRQSFERFIHEFKGMTPEEKNDAEQFFLSLFPVEIRCVIPPSALCETYKQLRFMQALRKNTLSGKWKEQIHGFLYQLQDLDFEKELEELLKKSIASLGRVFQLEIREKQGVTLALILLKPSSSQQKVFSEIIKHFSKKS